MKTIQKLLVFSCAFLLLVGCQKEETFVGEDSARILKAGKNPVIESVTGSGHFTRDDFHTPDVWRTFSINASRKLDGTVKGTYQIHDHNTTMIKGKVLCFTIFDNKAVLIVTLDTYRTSVPEYEYNYGYIVVEDNGQGSDALPDRITTLWNSDDQSDCGVLKDVESDLRIVESGNIKIHK